MRAIQVAVFGGPDVLTPVELPDPVPDAGQVVVGMAVSDVIFLDTLLRGGWGQDLFPRPLPYIPGGGGAGVVLRTGDGVDPAWVGRRVVARTSTGYAEQVVADVGEVTPVPEALPLETAAAFIHDGVTALDLRRVGAPAKGEWVLVTAAAGARVVAAASSEAKLALARDLGAEVAVDYTRPDWTGRVRSLTGGGAALAYDGAGGPLGTATVDAVGDGGRFVTYGTSDGFAAPDPRTVARRGLRVVTPLTDGPPPPEVVRELMALALAKAVGGAYGRRSAPRTRWNAPRTRTGRWRSARWARLCSSCPNSTAACGR